MVKYTFKFRFCLKFGNVNFYTSLNINHLNNKFENIFANIFINKNFSNQ